MPASRCTNNLHRRHTKKGYRNRVRKCSKTVLEKYRNILPEYLWPDDTRLCATCQLEINKLVNNKVTARGILNLIQKSSTTSRNFQILEPVETFATTPENQENYSSQGSLSEPNNSISQNQRPCTSTQVSGFTSSDPLSIPISDFQNEITPRERINEVLRTLGESPLKPYLKSNLGMVRMKYSKSCSALGTLFTELSTQPANENLDECNNCKRIVETVELKLSALSIKEKYMLLTSIPFNYSAEYMQTRFQISSYMARNASHLRKAEGPFSFPQIRSKAHPISSQVVDLIKQFYLSDDNSRPSPAMRDTVQVRNENGELIKEAKRWMLGSAREIYCEFKNVYPNVKVSLSKFLELRPKQCKWQGNHWKYNTCTCIYHENFKFMIEAVSQIFSESQAMTSQTENIGPILRTPDDLFRIILCNPPKEECYEGFCTDCSIEEKFDRLFDGAETDFIVKYKMWESTTSTNLVTVQMDINDFKDKFRQVVNKFLFHDFIYKKQKIAIKKLKDLMDFPNTVATILVDFGQNYSFLVQNAVQGFHWNNSQATIHPFVVNYKDESNALSYITYFGISDDLNHDASCFHAMRVDMLKKLKSDFPWITHVEYVSDGASHYKSRFNLANLVYHRHDFGITGNWTYSATSHGKSTCDAMSAVAKRGWRSLSLKGVLITSAETMFEEARQRMTTDKLKFFYTKKAAVLECRQSLQERYNGTRGVPGLRNCHSIKIEDDGTVISRKHSESLSYEKHEIFNETMQQVFVTVSNLTKGKFYAIYTSSSYQIGKLIHVDTQKLTIQFSLLKRTGRGGKTLVWPLIPKMFESDLQNVIAEIRDPVVTSTGYLTMTDLDREVVKQNLLIRMESVFNS